MDVYIPNMEMPTSCEKCPFLDYEEGFCFASGVKGKSGWYEFTWCPSGIKDGRHKDCPLVPVPPHGRLIDADKIGLTNFEIILCQKGNPFKNALEMLLEKIENAPTIIPADSKDTDVPTREECE